MTTLPAQAALVTTDLLEDYHASLQATLQSLPDQLCSLIPNRLTQPPYLVLREISEQLLVMHTKSFCVLGKFGGQVGAFAARGSESQIEMKTLLGDAKGVKDAVAESKAPGTINKMNINLFRKLQWDSGKYKHGRGGERALLSSQN
jgi:hypothetical protein